MIKLGFDYGDEFEKFSAEHISNDESVNIEYCIEKFCRFLIGMSYSTEIIEKYIGFDGYDVYTMKEWVENREDNLND